MYIYILLVEHAPSMPPRSHVSRRGRFADLQICWCDRGSGLRGFLATGVCGFMRLESTSPSSY